jgi:hypothetical protein
MLMSLLTSIVTAILYRNWFVRAKACRRGPPVSALTREDDISRPVLHFLRPGRRAFFAGII